MESHVLNKPSVKKIMAGILTSFLALSFVHTSASAAAIDAPEERLQQTNNNIVMGSRQNLFIKIPVLIAVDEEYRAAHPDWMNLQHEL